MAEPVDALLPDEIETLQALAEAAAALNGELCCSENRTQMTLISQMNADDSSSPEGAMLPGTPVCSENAFGSILSGTEPPPLSGRRSAVEGCDSACISFMQHGGREGHDNSADDGWRLRLPGAPGLAVRITDAAAFPLELSSPDLRVALPACADVIELADALRDAVLRQEARRPVDLTAQEPAGWQRVSAEAGRIELARTDQAARGWPATAEVTLASGAAIVETRQPLAVGDDAALAAVDHLLAWASQGLVQTFRKPGADGAPCMTSASTGAPHPPEQTICYRLATPAVTLMPARLADALALVGVCYRDLAPALNALAEHPALAETYLTLQRRSK